MREPHSLPCSQSHSSQGEVHQGCLGLLLRMLLTYSDTPCPICPLRFKSQFFLNALGLLFAVAESQENPSFLPNITVGLQIHDSCVSGTQALRSTLALLSNQLRPTPNFSCGPQRLLLGVIGGMTSPESLPMAELLSMYRVPQVRNIPGERSHSHKHVPSYSGVSSQ